MGSYQCSVLQKYVDYLNQNIFDDSINILSKKVFDLILVNLKKFLNNVKFKVEKKKEFLNLEENKFFKNEIVIFEQF